MKLISKIKTTSFAFVAIAALVLTLTPSRVNAQSLCVPGTEGNECVRCVQGPYNICVPETDIVIGDATITSETIIMLGIVYLAGVLLIVNGSVLKKFAITGRV